MGGGGRAGLKERAGGRDGGEGDLFVLIKTSDVFRERRLRAGMLFLRNRFVSLA